MLCKASATKTTVCELLQVDGLLPFEAVLLFAIFKTMAVVWWFLETTVQDSCNALECCLRTVRPMRDWTLCLSGRRGVAK